jgi:protein-disulfide isomerase
VRALLGPVANGIVSACALTGLGILLGRGIEPRASATEAEPELTPVREWPRIAEGGTAVGPAGAPAVLVTFSDFQCPFCARLAESVAALRREQPDRFRMVYRHFPLRSIHPHAWAAALASECAAAQGRFEPFHDELFARQDEIGALGWTDLAASAEVPDTVAFASCMAHELPAARIRADVALGDAVGVTGTPTVFLNGSRVRAGVSPERLAQLVAEAARSPAPR